MHIALVMNLPSSVHFSKFKFNYFNYISFFLFLFKINLEKLSLGSLPYGSLLRPKRDFSAERKLT